MQTSRSERATATITEVAIAFGIARSTAYELAQRDALPVPVIHLGRRMVVPRAALDRLLAAEGERQPSDDAA
jgi:predicted DNA-binding transcriptional regulator AlpA